MVRKFIFSFFVFLFLVHGVARADSNYGESYATPTYKEVTQTVLLLGGYDVNDNNIVDSYARLLYCDLYTQSYKDDFVWNKIRANLMSNLVAKKESYRVLYQVIGNINLGRYDFERQRFPVTSEGSLANIKTVVIVDPASMAAEADAVAKKVIVGDKVVTYAKKKPAKDCDVGQQGSYFSKWIAVDLGQPIDIKFISVPQEQAQRIIGRLKFLKNENRTLFLRIRLRLLSVDAVRKNRWGKSVDAVIMGGEVTQLDLFYDKEMTNWIMSVPLYQEDTDAK